jgi:RsiW-degrading membrane proteinase PrsW (M82 family)
MQGARRGNVAFTVVVTALVCLGALPVLLLLAVSGAPSSLLLATVLAALPVGPLVACYLWLDRYEPEPRRLLAFGLLWGGFVATAGALLVQGAGSWLIGFSEQQSLAIVAPVTEELTKGLFLVLLLWWRRNELDGILDGIVYAGMVGIGFAFIENILYLASAYNGAEGMPGGSGALTSVFLVRCLFSPFAHPLFTTFTGIGVGIAVGSRSRAVRIGAPLAGYALAVVAHAIWNGSTLYGFTGFVGAYVVLMAPAFIGMVALAVWARRSEQRMLVASLTDAAHRGLIPATDIGWLVSLRARRAGRAHALAHGGPQAHRAMRDYQQAAVELGFLHHRFLRGVPPPDFLERGQLYVERIAAARPFVVFPGQVVPSR